MVTVIVNGTKHVAEEGVTLSSVLAPTHSVGMPCGGRKSCGKCKVIATGSLSELSKEELKFLSSDEISGGIRLACCTVVKGDCQVTSILDGDDSISTEGDIPDMALDPVFKKYGVAIDIGTTTLAARLYDTHGRMIADCSEINPQRGFGADVISRIEAALGGAATELAKVIRKMLNSMILGMSQKANISSMDVDSVVITGNTVMLHLLTETSTEPLSHAPFDAQRLFGETVSASELDLNCLEPQTPVYLPICAEAFIGADLTTALLASRITESDRVSLLVDIGTNGEMTLVNGDSLFLCSTAAGPAFEGAGLSMGMGAKTGAITKVRVENGEFKVNTIGNASPIGICGSGVVDAVAALLEAEILDETGYLDDDEAIISAPVSISQNDIRMVQLAKSAIHAGMRTLLHYAKIDCEQVDQLCIAGGFGSYLDIVNAGKIGLIPNELVPKVRVLGNAALVGAAMLLLNGGMRTECERILARGKVVILSADPVFNEEYVERMLF